MTYTLSTVKITAQRSPSSPEHIRRIAVLARRARLDDMRMVASRAQLRTTVLPSVCPGVWSHKRKAAV